MSLELHEWDIHIVCFGTDGARVTRIGLFPPAAPACGGKLTGQFAL
jgi:hypothetical protein